MPTPSDPSPVTIRHRDAGDGAAPEAAEFAVYWHHDWPVGQRWTGPGPACTPAMDPAILARARAGVALEAHGRPPDGRRVSVVICTRDRADALRACLASLPAQTRRPDQVVVVDNASRDGGATRAATREAGADYVREDRAGLDVARNRGIAAATGDLIAFTDDDVRLHPRWLERLAAAFDAPGVMAVTGLVLPAALDTPAQLHFERHWGFGRGYRPIDYGADFFAVDRKRGCPVWLIGAGASMAFRRDVFDRVGRFDERLDVGAAGCSGDSELWHRILTHGYVCRYEPAAVAFHTHRRDDAALARQIRAYMRGHAAALLVQYERSGHRGNLRRALATMPAWYVRRCAGRLLRGPSERDRLLRDEIGGYVAGLLFYLRTPRPRAAGSVR